MSSKKLMAAALAAVMAVGTVSTVAFAEEGVDTWTIDGSKAGDKTFTEATINPYFAFNVPTAVYNTWATIKDGTKNDGNDYNKELSIALWESTKDYNFKDFKGGSATLEMKGTAVDYVPAQMVIANQAGNKYTIADTGNDFCPKIMVPKLTDGNVIIITTTTGAKAGELSEQPATVGYKIATKAELDAAKADQTTAPTFAGAEVNPSGVDKVYKSSATSGDLKDAYVFGTSAAATQKVVSKTVTGKNTVTIGSTFRDSTGDSTQTGPEGSKFGKQTNTVQFIPSFDGLSDTVRLVEVSADSKITVDVSGTVDGKTWTGYYLDSDKKALWSLTGTKDYTFSWDNTTTGTFGGNSNSTRGLQVLVGYPAPGVASASQAPLTFKSNPDVKEDNEDLTIPLVNDIFSTNSWLGFGDIVPPAMLKALNEGGSIEFEFSRELKSNEYFTGAMMFGVANGAIANNFSIEPTYGNGKTATVTIPAGLTYYADEKNPWQSVGLGWRFSFQKLGQGLFAPTDNSAGTDKVVTGVKIVKMTFKTNGAAVDNNSGSTSGSTSGNNGGNTSGSKDPNGNPPTGIALAVAPVILAAGAVVAISASKKRK